MHIIRVFSFFTNCWDTFRTILYSYSCIQIRPIRIPGPESSVGRHLPVNYRQLLATSSNHGLWRHYFSYSLAQQYKCMANKNSQIFVHLSGLCMYSVHHQCNKHYGWIIPVFWCIVVCGRKISYPDTYFSILVYQLDWLGSDFLYGLSIPNFWFELKIADVFVMYLLWF